MFFVGVCVRRKEGGRGTVKRKKEGREGESDQHELEKERKQKTEYSVWVYSTSESDEDRGYKNIVVPFRLYDQEGGLMHILLIVCSV